MFSKIKAKIKKTADRKMLVEEYYDKWMKMPLHELYDEASYYLINNRHGHGYDNEVYTYHRVAEDRGITGKDIVDAKQAADVANKLEET
jgi:hypothetical protein